MTALRGCPYCNGWMRWGDYLCDECNGENARKSYRKRTTNLSACLHAAAVEELRVRCAIARMRDAAAASYELATAERLLEAYDAVIEDIPDNDGQHDFVAQYLLDLRCDVADECERLRRAVEEMEHL